MTQIIVYCSEKNGRCGCAVAMIEGGNLIIRGRHHGQRHTSVVSLAKLAEVAGKNSDAASIA
jgi:hypothetical protein